jgi:hypothetical protein
MAGMTSMPEITAFNLNPEQANEMFLRPLFVSNSILDSMDVRVMRNVKREAAMYLLGEMTDILQVNPGCGWTPKGKMPTSQRTVVTKKHKVNLELCTDEFWGTCFEWMTGNGLDIHKLDATELGNQVLNFWITRIQQGLLNDMFRIAFYSDDTSVLPFYAQNNGWFKQIEQDIADGLTPAAVATGSGAPLTPGDSEAIFQGMIDAQTDELEDVPVDQKVFMVSKSIWNDYRNFLKSNVNLESDRMRLIDGVQTYYYEGIEIKRCPQFDRADNELGNADFHRAVLTWKGNLTVATDVNAGDTQFSIRFDEDTELHKIKTFLRLGFQVALPELVVYGV